MNQQYAFGRGWHNAETEETVWDVELELFNEDDNERIYDVLFRGLSIGKAVETINHDKWVVEFQEVMLRNFETDSPEGVAAGIADGYGLPCVADED